MHVRAMLVLSVLLSVSMLPNRSLLMLLSVLIILLMPLMLWTTIANVCCSSVLLKGLVGCVSIVLQL